MPLYIARNQEEDPSRTDYLVNTRNYRAAGNIVGLNLGLLGRNVDPQNILVYRMADAEAETLAVGDLPDDNYRPIGSQVLDVILDGTFSEHYKTD